MQLSSPTAVTWWVTVVAAVIGLVLEFTKLFVFPILGIGLGFWIVFLAFVLLAVACIVKGL
jgi:glucan phosphoethanolaminetransferase (alkaline phosphatase superfamily)